MRSTALFALLVSWSFVASAQARRPAAPAPAATGTEAEAPAVEPVEEEGWTVVRFGSEGYARWRTDETDRTEPAGEVFIVPTATTEVEVADDAGTRDRARPEAERRPHPRRDERCLEEERALAQRLIELQGLDVDPVTAELLLTALTSSGYAAWARGGLPGPSPEAGRYGGQFLYNAATWDLWTRSLAEDLAHCLAEAK